jgi:hypothetical protein
MIQNLSNIENVYTKDSILLQKEYRDIFHSMLRSLKVLPLNFSIDSALLNDPDIWKHKLQTLDERRSKKEYFVCFADISVSLKSLLPLTKSQ